MVPHGIMFHHFHDASKHYQGPGSIDTINFKDILQYLQSKFCILSPKLWIKKNNEGSLREKDICLTFDDGLKCQVDIALPVLEEFKLKAFFFSNSFALTGETDPLEVYRKFRSTYFKDFKTFYESFYEMVLQQFDTAKLEPFLKSIDIKKYLEDYPFYCMEDIYYRLIRDQFLSNDEYERLMEDLIKEKGVDIASLCEGVWMNETDLSQLHHAGHEVGLHAHYHHTEITQLGYQGQYDEYSKNKSLLETVTQSAIQSVAYPCGAFDRDTKRVMNELEIKIGFNCHLEDMKDPMRLPRKDHVVLLNEMRAI